MRVYKIATRVKCLRKNIRKAIIKDTKDIKQVAERKLSLIKGACTCNNALSSIISNHTTFNSI